MGWTDVGSKVGRLILDSSQPIINQLHRSRSLPRQQQQESPSPPPQDDLRSSGDGEFRGPDTSSLSAFLYSFLSSPQSASGGADESRASSSWEEGFSGDPDADWFVVSGNELEHSIMEDYLTSHFESQEAIAKLPPASEESSLLSDKFRSVLYPSLPTIVQGRTWVLLYSTARDGISLHTLYRKSVLLPGPCLLVAGDRKGAVFGGLLLAPFKPTRNKYQGTNQTFVFTNVSGPAKVFRPTGRNRYYFLCTNDALAIGGGGHFALYLDSDLLTGSSGACETFGSECLAHAEDFDLKDVELWGFAHSSQRSSLGKTTNAFESL
ncbi:TLD domain-containing protein 2 isoform X1 [Selaginella moellendorffii]|uniref:TLD domain-containing protein 2 isoform X1 n=1 Tax=Selaginella moellendorffii TaxID=88036 RepID=UPI000D1C2CD6|nr:TLD domain-containing protein 2 isoform X1 [Selaginella moellendorffii]|eukprot:XP_024535996.1 TLD domain-containing protein 2 isoform X1 [Selaginella moellendorffii]